MYTKPTVGVEFTQKEASILSNSLQLAMDVIRDTEENNPIDKGHGVMNVLRKINAAIAQRKYNPMSHETFESLYPRNWEID
jgi:hypothetical protein